MNKQRGLIPGVSDVTIFVIGAIALASVLFYLRMHWIQVGREEILRENVTIARKIVKEVETKTNTIVKWRVKREKEIEHVFHTVYQDVVQEVPVRVGCNVTRGWMLGHDYAAEGADKPKPRGVDDKADTGINEAKQLAVVAGNYEKYHRVANDLKACREQVKAVEEAFNKDR